MNYASEDALPRGFGFAAVNCGLRKPPNLDLGLILAEKPVAAAGVFTQNLVQAAPVVLSREPSASRDSRIRAVIVNSRNANCATGTAGMAAAKTTAQEVAREIGCEPEQVLVCSTGVIGVPLRVERILAAVPGLAHSVAGTPEAFDGFTHAIMTTDTRPKWAAANCILGGKKVRLLGCAKGAGMIHPNMATMLGYIVTDAAIRASVLQRALSTVVRTTFNAITVDGDTSTNDTVLVLASGEAGNRALAPQSADYRRFLAALEELCHSLALQIVGDGEGASHVIEIEVRGAPSDAAAEQGGAHHRRIAAGENNVRGRRSQLGPHPGGGGARRREIRSREDRHPHGRASHLPERHRASFQRAEGAPALDAELRARRRGPWRRLRTRACVDLRFHDRLRAHQRRIPHLSAWAERADIVILRFAQNDSLFFSRCESTIVR